MLDEFQSNSRTMAEQVRNNFSTVPEQFQTNSTTTLEQIHDNVRTSPEQSRKNYQSDKPFPEQFHYRLFYFSFIHFQVTYNLFTLNC